MNLKVTNSILLTEAEAFCLPNQGLLFRVWEYLLFSFAVMILLFEME